MSDYHARLDPRRWARARRQALRRAGHRSELSGRAGRLEVHHRVRLEDGGDPYDLENLMVVTRGEHIQLHREDHLTEEQIEWRRYVENYWPESE